MQIKAYAKINLGLDVIRRRADGYHEVKMIMQNVDLYDELIIEKNSSSGIVISTNKDFLPVNEDNLVYKAVKLLFDEFNITDGIDIKLIKNIPVAAGMAGGSTDAAATLKAVNQLWNLGLSETELMERGVKIGADIPYCIMGGTAVSEGIGEILTRIENCPDCTVLIAKPPVGVSTKYVYQNLKIDELSHPDIDAIIDGIRNNNLQKIADNLGNVLETVTISLHPVIEDIKKYMIDSGALASLMSGSGPTVFGLFDDKEKAEECARIIDKANVAGDIIVTRMYNSK